MATRSRKVTYYLSEELLAAIDQAVARGVAPSKNALVERALARAIEEIEQEWLRRQWEEAARDPLFLKDIQEVEEDFRFADAETARGIV